MDGFIIENPMKMDDLGGKPTIFGNIHFLEVAFIFSPQVFFSSPQSALWISRPISFLIAWTVQEDPQGAIPAGPTYARVGTYDPYEWSYGVL